MPHFGKRSENTLSTLHPFLQLVCRRVIPYFDFSIICGFRNEEDQNKAFKDGKSQLQFPHSKHNQLPSEAMDLAPYPIDWNNIARFNRLAGMILMASVDARIDHPEHFSQCNLRWGGDWKNFKDYPHYELFRESKETK